MASLLKKGRKLSSSGKIFQTFVPGTFFSQASCTKCSTSSISSHSIFLGYSALSPATSFPDKTRNIERISGNCIPAGRRAQGLYDRIVIKGSKERPLKIWLCNVSSAGIWPGALDFQNYNIYNHNNTTELQFASEGRGPWRVRERLQISWLPPAQTVAASPTSLCAGHSVHTGCRSASSVNRCVLILAKFRRIQNTT
jgi:hypothetical protein